MYLYHHITKKKKTQVAFTLYIVASKHWKLISFKVKYLRANTKRKAKTKAGFKIENLVRLQQFHVYFDNNTSVGSAKVTLYDSLNSSSPC